MGILNFTTTTFSSLFKKSATCCYPEESRPQYEGLKGQIAIVEENCILCGKCTKACPADAIEVERKDRIWSIDHYRCVTCFSCVRACPKKCLSMSPKRASVTRKMTKDTHVIPETKKEKEKSE